MSGSLPAVPWRRLRAVWRFPVRQAPRGGTASTPDASSCPAPMAPRVRALLLDFDGTMLETESSSYGSWRELLAEHDYELTHDDWAAAVGTLGGGDPVALLEEHLGAPGDRDAGGGRQAGRPPGPLTEGGVRPGIPP